MIIIKTMKNTLQHMARYAILALKGGVPMSVTKYQIYLKTVELGSFTAAPAP